ncbi:hypothetical protein QFC21_001502 [Naganishia friedmannii]|uniref:Uncharacterized protein n=1 Tax=Naganishia friedmannii TaxID=89922 RepID=A0ACC2W4L6_9TREE|nr:hypothetical protein QFC21_001502 [Naganishia friedmannii]
MPLAAQRRHVIASLHHPFPAILLYQHLLCPNLILLVIRSFVQTRIATPRKSHPEATLRILAFFVLGLNLFAAFIHVLDLAEGAMPGKSLLIDFVGLKTAPKAMVILGLDAFITVYQLVTLYIGYLSFPAPNGTSQGFPVDPLLPPHRSRGPNEMYRASAKDVIFQSQEDDEESQILNARKQGGRAGPQTSGMRRSGFNRDNSPSSEREEEEYDLYSEDDDLLQRTDPDGDVSGDTYEYQRPSSKEEPYTIVDIPIFFMLKTILTYPRPSSVTSLDTSAAAETIATAERTSTDRTSEPEDIPQRRRMSSVTSTDLRIQALGGLYPGTTNPAGREQGTADSSEEEDGRVEYRRMPGGYSRASA